MFWGRYDKDGDFYILIARCCLQDRNAFVFRTRYNC